MQCKWTPEEIKGKIEDNVAKLATDTRLFERVGNTLIPTIDDDTLVNSALQYKDDMKIPFYKDILLSNPRGILQEISNQVYGRTATGDVSTFALGKDTVGNEEEIGDANEKVAVEMFGQSLVDIATKVYPLTTSPSHGEVRGDINRQYGDDVIKKQSGLYVIDIPEDVVNQSLREINSQPNNERESRVDIQPVSKLADFQENVLNFTAYLSRKFAVTSNIIEDETKQWAAKIEDGKVIINTAYANYSDVWHEFSHPLLISMRLKNKDLFDNLYNSLKTTDEWSDIYQKADSKVRRLYPEYKSNIDDYKEEVIATALGYAAGDKTSITSKFLYIIRQFIDWVSKLLNLDGATSVYIRELNPNMSFSDFISLVQDEDVIVRPEKGWENADLSAKGAQGSLLRDIYNYNKNIDQTLTPFLADIFHIPESSYKPRLVATELKKQKARAQRLSDPPEPRRLTVYEEIEKQVTDYISQLQPSGFQSNFSHLMNSMEGSMGSDMVVPATQGNPIDITSDYIRKLQADPTGKTQLDKPFSSSTASDIENKVLQEFYTEYMKEINAFFKGKPPKSIDNKRLLNKYIAWLSKNYPVSYYLTQPQQVTYGLNSVISKAEFTREQGQGLQKKDYRDELKNGYEVLIANKYLLKTGHRYNLYDEQGNRLHESSSYNGTGWYIYHELYGDIPLAYEYQSDVIDDLESLASQLGIRDKEGFLHKVQSNITNFFDNIKSKKSSIGENEFANNALNSDPIMEKAARNFFYPFPKELREILEKSQRVSADIMKENINYRANRVEKRLETERELLIHYLSILSYMKNTNLKQRLGYLSKLKREGKRVSDLINDNILHIEEVNFILKGLQVDISKLGTAVSITGNPITTISNQFEDNGMMDVNLKTFINSIANMASKRDEMVKFLNALITKSLNGVKEGERELYYIDQIKKSGSVSFHTALIEHRFLMMERVAATTDLLFANEIGKVDKSSLITDETIDAARQSAANAYELLEQAMQSTEGAGDVDVIKQIRSLKNVQLRFFIEHSFNYAKGKGKDKIYLPTAQFIDEVEGGDPWTLYVTPWDKKASNKYLNSHLGSFYEALTEIPDIKIEYKKVDGLTQPVLEVDISQFNKPVERFSKIDQPFTEDQAEILYDESKLREEAGIEEGDTPLQFMEKSSLHQEQVSKFLKANPQVKMEWGDEFSVFDQNANIISIALSELYTISIRSQIPFQTVVSNFILHEMAHAASYYAMRKGTNDQLPTKLLNIAKEFHDNNPFEDQLRSGFVQENGLPYAFKDIDEFVSEAFSNPFFQDYLKQIPYEQENKTLWQKLVDWVLSLFGAKRDSVYDKVVDYINSSKIQRDNLEGMLTPDFVDMQLYYRGNPKDYISARYEYFTSPRVKSEVDTIFKKLPEAVAKLKAIEKVQNEPGQRRRIQSLLNAFNEVKGKEEVIPVYINMLVAAARIAKDIEDQMTEAGRMEDGMEKVAVLNSLLTTAQNLQFITPLASDILAVMDKEGYQNIESLTRFVAQLRGIISVEATLKQRFIKLVTPSIQTYFSSLYPENSSAVAIRAQIDDIKKKLESPTMSDRDRKFYNDKIDRLESELMKMPVPETFAKIFAGEYHDSSILQAWLEAPAINAHPLVASTFAILRSMDIKTTQDMLNTENEHDRQFRRVRTLSTHNIEMRDPRNAWKPITNEVKYVGSTDEDGKLSFLTTRMLLSPYLPSYLEEHFKYDALEDYYRTKMNKARKDQNEELYNQYYSQYEAQVKARQAFQKENSERKYTDEVYDMYELLDKQIMLPGGDYTTFRKERGDIFREIEDLENKRNQATTLEDQEEIQAELDEKNVELRELRSIYLPTGEKKTGIPLAIAEVANEYFELRGKYGRNILTDEGKASFERTMLHLKEEFDRGFLTKQQYDAAVNDNTTTELDEEYFKKIDEFSDLIQEATDKIADVPELRAILGKIDRQAIKDGYKKIKALTQAFRDNNGIIDGQLFSRVRPELVVQIRDIQQQVEDLKNKTERLKGLSVEEALELKELTEREIARTISSQEQNRVDELRSMRAEKKAIYQRNKTLIDGYHELVKGLSELMTVTNTQYYLNETNDQLNKIKNDLKEQVKQELMYNGSIDDGTYFRRDGKWWKIISTNQETGETQIKEIVETKDNPAVDQIVDEVVTARSEDLVKQSDWWRDNHYTAYDWDKKIGYFPVERPIYIWARTLPKNAEYVKAGQPSWRFKTYQIFDKHVNTNHREIYPYVPVNKADKYTNDAYFKLEKDDKALFGYLEFLRSEYQLHQQIYPPEKYLGDILPGVVKTEEELKVIGTKGLLLKSTYQKLFSLTANQDEATAEDTKMLVGRSQGKYYIERRVLPTRFTGKMSIDKQSADIPAMILAYILGTKKYANLSTVHPVLESLRTIAETLPVQELHNFGLKFSVRNLMTIVRGQSNKLSTVREKNTKQSNLSKSIDFVLNTFMYDQTKNSSVSHFLGMEIDWQTASRNLKKLASFALFSVKPFIAIKNTLSAKVQAQINTNVGKGFYTYTDLVKGQVAARKYIGNFVMDYKKFGNKSFIGQAIDYFQVLRGTAYNAYGRKTQWTELKNATDYLSVMKNISEFEVQITQFLAMSSANRVLVAGKEVPLIDAFELDEKKNFRMKENTTTTDGKPLDKKWLDAFIMRVTWVNRNINGAYRHDETNMAQKTVLGGLAFYLNGYVFPGIYNRYGSTRYSIEAQQITKGYWREAFSFVRAMAVYRRGLMKQWGELRPEEKARVHRFLKEMGFILALFFLGIAMGSGDDRKKLKKNTDFYNYMLALAMTVKSETETFFPAPAMGLNELSRKINSPFAALRQISLLIQTADNGIRYIFGSDDAFYKKTGIHDGFHDKGDAKVVANFLKIWGWTGYEFDPLERVGAVRRASQFR